LLRLLLRLRRRVFLPAPLLFQLFVQKADAPAGFLTDLLEDLEDFFLLSADGQAFGGDGE